MRHAAHSSLWVRQLTARLHGHIRLTGRAAWRALRRLIDSDDFTFASSIAYYSLLSLFPCFMLLLAVLGVIAADPDDRAAVFAFVLRYFPGQLSFVMAQLETLEVARIQLGVFGVIAMTWASLGVFRAITSAVNYAWDVEDRGSYVKHQLIGFGMLVCAGVLLLLAILAFSMIDVVQASWFSQLSARIPDLEIFQSLTGLAFRYAATLLLVVVVALIFYFVPNTDVRFRDVWLGAIMTGLLWRGALASFSWFIRDPARLSVHGSIAAVVGFLIWVYVSAVILLYGVEFTAAYARLRRDAVLAGRTVSR